MINFLNKVSCYEKYENFGKVINGNYKGEKDWSFINVLKELE